MMDSSIWNDFDFRNDDIIIASYPKSGTTWMQQIVGQLLLNGKEFDLKKISFWLDRNPDQREKLEVLNMQTHRRFIQTHLPADAMVFSPTAKYIYIVRDGRDIVLSYHHFLLNLDEQFFTLINNAPGYEDYPQFVRPTKSAEHFFDTWLDGGELNELPFWNHIKSWWNIKELPNVTLLHFSKMKRDLERYIRQIAEFLDIAIDESRLDTLLEHCSFDYMKSHAGKIVPLAIRDNPEAFFRNGSEHSWQDILTDEQSRRYEEMARERLGENCACWLFGQ